MASAARLVTLQKSASRKRRLVLSAREAFTDELKGATLAQIAADDAELRSGELPGPLVEQHR